MCSIIADSEQHRFLIGTCSVPPTTSSIESRHNELHLLSYSEDSNRIDVERVYRLPDPMAEVSQLSSSPYNRNVTAVGLSTFKGEQEESKQVSRLQRAHSVVFYEFKSDSDSLKELA